MSSREFSVLMSRAASLTSTVSERCPRASLKSTRSTIPAFTTKFVAMIVLKPETST